MTPTVYPKIEAALHPERLDAYRQDGADEKTALARYALNIALCEALYPALQFAEIALRNSIHDAFSQRYGRDDWYDAPALVLLPWQAIRLREAKMSLLKLRKPATPGRLVAELSFGFWTGFFNKAQNHSGLSHYLAKTAFPNAPKQERRTDRLDRRLLEIRDLRNRIFHHERIIHWTDLDDRHASIIETIQWISPHLKGFALVADRFPSIRQDGLTPWLAKISTL